MRSYNINPDGSGNGPDSDFINRILKRLTELQFYDSQTIKVEQTTRGTRFHAKPSKGGGAGGWDWMYNPKELDTTRSYSKGKWAYISALNSLVTAGMTDIVSNATVVSCQGYWQCVQDVPAAAGGKFNVPVFPAPAGATAIGGTPFLAGTTAPSGTPLLGDLDLLDATTGKPTLYWCYFGDVT